MKNLVCLVVLAVLLTACRTAPPPANSRANAGVKATLRYFQGLETRRDRRLVSGQFANFGQGANLRIMDEIYRKTGHWPAILGVDYADFSNGGITCAAPNRAAIEYWKQGGLVSISAHLPNPANTNGGGLRDKGVNLDALLAPENPAHRRWMRQLDEVARGLQELEDAGVVVMWRPFHEMNGDWFWWGAKDPEAFIRLWRHMFDYFTRTKGLDNLLWVYSPNQGPRTIAYYPGEHCVDMIGLDAYTDFIDRKHIRGYPELSQINKPFGFTEFGPHAPSNPPGDYDYLRLIQGIQKEFPRTVYFMCWNANWGLARNLNVAELLGHPWVVNRSDLPRGVAGGR